MKAQVDPLRRLPAISAEEAEHSPHDVMLFTQTAAQLRAVQGVSPLPHGWNALVSKTHPSQWAHTVKQAISFSVWCPCP